MHVGALSVFEGAQFFDERRTLPHRRGARARAVAAAVAAAVPTAFDAGALRPGPAGLDRRRPFRHHVSRAAHRAAEAGIVGAAGRAHDPCTGAAARPRTPPVGAVVRRRARRRTCRADPEDASFADRRRVGCRRRDVAARHEPRLRASGRRGVDARTPADSVAAAARQPARARDRTRRVRPLVPLDAARPPPGDGTGRRAGQVDEHDAHA